MQAQRHPQQRRPLTQQRLASALPKAMLRLSAAVLRTPLRMARVILSSDPNDVAYVADRDRGSGPSGHLSNQMCGAGSYASARI